jgi:hypothetical protein
MHRLPRLMMIVSAGAATVTPASAGTLIVGTYTGTRTPNGRTVEFRIQDGRGKITGSDGQSIYYDHVKRTAYIVDTQKGTSFEMDEARAKQVGAQLADAQRQMEAKLKELPPNQRAQVEKMMKEQGGGPAPAGGRRALQFSKAGSAKVGSWACDRYKASGDGREVAVCSTEPDTVGIPAADVAVFEGFLDLSEMMAGDAGGGVSERGFPGLPLERSETHGGKVTDRFTIERIESVTMAASDVEVPPGLKPVTPPGARSVR